MTAVDAEFGVTTSQTQQQVKIPVERERETHTESNMLQQPLQEGDLNQPMF